mmetsp:Transcript_22460/g.53316  ORF Transcript_22460/g.53316 Transcript_22460/m.53316 type:complete len:227 (+) Transcript_22460:1609-2289(+)
MCDYDVFCEPRHLHRQLVGRVLDDDHPGRAIVHLRRSRPMVVGMVPKRAAHVVFRDAKRVLVRFARADGRVYDIVARNVRRNMEPVRVQVDRVEPMVVVGHRRGADLLGLHVILQQDAQRVSSAHAERWPWRPAGGSRHVEAEHLKILLQAGAFLGDRDVAELQRDAQRAVAGLVARARADRVGHLLHRSARELVRPLKIDAAAGAEELDQKEHAPHSHVVRAHHH